MSFKAKAQERDKQVVRDVLDDNCHCYALGCCPGAFLKLEAIDGSGNDYIWNDGTQLVVGTKEQFEAAYLAANPK